MESAAVRPGTRAVLVYAGEEHVLVNVASSLPDLEVSGRHGIVSYASVALSSRDMSTYNGQAVMLGPDGWNWR